MVLTPNGRRERAADLYRSLPDRTGVALAILSAVLVALAFPNFDLSPLAWVALVPLLYAIVFRTVTGLGAFVLGWLFGIGYFVGTVYWLTYAMIHYGSIPTPVAYLLLVVAGILFGLFTAGFGWILRRLADRRGALAVWLAPVLWIALAEWLRFQITGQLWNALGYSQAFHPNLIQAARFGGVYAVSFLIVLANATVAYWLGHRTLNKAGLLWSGLTVLLVGGALALGVIPPGGPAGAPTADIVIVQPNVPMEPAETAAETDALMKRHISLSETQLARLNDPAVPRLVIWPESPMSFAYSRDTLLRTDLAAFATRNRTSLLINSMETAPNDGAYNSAVMIDAQGGLASQYDKIYLLQFGEYMPIPGWVPGVSLIPPIVGNFSAGDRFPLLPVGNGRAGVMICFESAVPSLARRYSVDGADMIIEISNDGYLGPTPVLRQHLANGIFRAVENRRPVVRATNAGISALITSRGEVQQPTAGFVPDARSWRVERATTVPTFYARYGDVLAIACTVVSLGLFVLAAARRRSATAGT
jgi:apolipoprotein N-acyltransferase